MPTASSNNVSRLEIFRDYMLGKYRRLAYFEALIPYTNIHKNPPYRFWRRYAVFYHPFLLYSYANSHYGEIHDLHREIDYSPEDTFLFIDSGGFQAAKGENISQDRVLEFLFRYGDAGPIVDYPPLGSEDLPRVWEKHLHLTKRNVDIVLKLYDTLAEKYNRRPIIYAVLQGFSPEQLEKWSRLVVQPMYETGLTNALGVGLVKSTSHYDIMYIVRFILDFLPETRIVHLFGIGDVRVIGLLMELSRFFDYLSTDSSNSSSSFVYGRIYIPFGNQVRIKNLRIGYYCPCPACQYYRRTKGHWPVEVIESMTTDMRMTIYVHNLFWIISRFTQISMLHVVSPLESFMKSQGYDYEAYNYMLGKDYKAFYNRYCKKFTSYYLRVAGGCRNDHSFF